MSEYYFIFNRKEIDFIIELLRDQPYKIAAPLIKKIEAQIQKQKNEREIMKLIGGASE